MTDHELPDVTTLTETQVRGAACVWGGGDLALTPVVVDLGTQQYPGPGARSAWFPRACLPCHLAAMDADDDPAGAEARTS